MVTMKLFVFLSLERYKLEFPVFSATLYARWRQLSKDFDCDGKQRDFETSGRVIGLGDTRR